MEEAEAEAEVEAGLFKLMCGGDLGGPSQEVDEDRRELGSLFSVSMCRGGLSSSNTTMWSRRSVSNDFFVIAPVTTVVCLWRGRCWLVVWAGLAA